MSRARELPPEFDRIARFLAPLAGPEGLGLLDDAALLVPPPGRELVVTADAIVAGVHFIGDEPPALIARKLLRVNLSDLAAKGATPWGYLSTLAVPRGTGDAWFADFAEGLARDQAEFGLSLFGGDTVATQGPLTCSATLLGHLAPGTMRRRSGARPGDRLCVTGTIGDAALGLAVAQGRLAADTDGYLLDRYRLPRPRFGLTLDRAAMACLDISDGLVQDAGHLARASGCGVVIEADRVPLSASARAAGLAWRETALTGGDDYELLVTVRPGVRLPATLTEIGHCVAGAAEVIVRDREGRTLSWPRGGYTHE